MTVGADATLDEASFGRLLDLARRRLERTAAIPGPAGVASSAIPGSAVAGSAPAGGTVQLVEPTEAERRAVMKITGLYRGEDATRLRVRLSDLDAAVRARTGRCLYDVLVSRGGPLRSRPAEREALDRQRGAALQRLGACKFAGAGWFTRFVDEVARDGTLTRLTLGGDLGAVVDFVAVLDLLPADDAPLPVLAEKATGRTKALSTGPLPALVLRALAAREGVPPPVEPAERQALYDGVGVLVDDLASTVLVLNVRCAPGPGLPDSLNAAADLGAPRRVMLYELVRFPLSWVVGGGGAGGGPVFVCENPSVLRAAASRLGVRCASLVCTEGQPSAAATRLLRAAVAAGARLAWRNDFDYAGLRMTATAIARYGAAPWRMGVSDLRAAVRRVDPGRVEPLRGVPCETPWDPGVAAELAALGHAVMEERLVDVLLADLLSG